MIIGFPDVFNRSTTTTTIQETCKKLKGFSCWRKAVVLAIT
jgi:hypothetical protein